MRDNTPPATSWRIVCSLAFGLAVVGRLGAQSPPESSERLPTANDKVDERNERIAHEIMHLRRQLGDPWSPPAVLTESTMEAAPAGTAGEFEAALRETIRRRSGPTAESARRQVGDRRLAGRAPRARLASRTAANERVRRLRSAARQLEQVGHDLEVLDVYQTADELRELAASLRRQARRLRAARHAVP